MSLSTYKTNPIEMHQMHEIEQFNNTIISPIHTPDFTREVEA